MKRCKHKRARYTGAHVYVEQTGPREPLVIGQCRCEACGEVVPLGPSDEEPVAVEVRAAKLAVQPAGTYVSADAQSGWVCAVNDCDPPPWPHCPDAWSGWLAHEIKMHDIEHPERDR